MLRRIGTPMYLVKILQDWLSDRRFYVALGADTSSTRSVPAGVPQGSSLSPLLYALYVADIPSVPQCTLAVYADDTALLAHSIQARGIVSRLQNGFRIINVFFTRWRIQVYPSKTEALFVPFDKNNRRLPQTPLQINNNTTVEYSDVVRYLGVYIDKGLTYKKHTENARHKAIGAFRAIFGLMAPSPTKWKRHLYLAIIRPIMCYGAESVENDIKRKLTITPGCPIRQPKNGV